MARHKRNPIRELCVKLVATHEERVRHIKRLEDYKLDIMEQIGSGDFNEMPRGSEVSNPVAQKYVKIEGVQVIINDEQRRVDAVVQAISKIGWQYNDEQQDKMCKAIVQNIVAGYHIPFVYSAYPFGREHFYRTRAIFLAEIAKNLNLMSKY